MNKFNEMNTQTPLRQHRNAEAALPFVGLTGGELIITMSKPVYSMIGKSQGQKKFRNITIFKSLMLIKTALIL